MTVRGIVGAMWLSRLVFAIPLLLFLVGAPGATWTSGEAALAVHLERTAAAPLYGLLAQVAAALPLGEPGFRLALLDAILAAIVVAGVVQAARALLPKAPVAALAPGILVAIAPAFREASGPSLLAAIGVLWALAALVEHAREPSDARAIAALAASTIVVGAAPWLGMLVLAVAFAFGGRALPSRTLAIVLGGAGLAIAALWSTALGRLPPFDPGLAPLVEAGRGSGAVALGAGLLGTAFAVATKLPHASRLGAIAALAAMHAIVVGRDTTAVIATLAVGAAVIPGAVVRAIGDTTRRHVVAAAAALPLVLAALLTGASAGPPDPRAAPHQLATDIAGRLPPGPGVIVPTRPTTWAAINYAQSVAGLRPDLALAPLPASDLVVADALRTDRVVGSDVPAFGRVDPLRSFPRGRGFEFLAKPPTLVAPVPSPARYASPVGEVEATLLALARARFEAGNGRLDAAARAVGLVNPDGTGRFRAADLAMLATGAPSAARPAMFAFVPPLDHASPGPWMFELFGDDLAWVAGLEVPAVETPRERKLHALWRQLWRGAIREDDPQIVELGPAAVAATRDMLAALKPPTK